MTTTQLQTLKGLLRQLGDETKSARIRDACLLVRRAAQARLSRGQRSPRVTESDLAIQHYRTETHGTMPWTFPTGSNP